ncbi:MAG: CBS domain-containing protein [Phycisphaerae bacterium]|nr:CBS domain-containing protein [Phycisphaerae bacterium]
MATVRELLRAKGCEIWSIDPEATAYEALQLMADEDIGALVVLDQDEMVGIFSERDYARKVVLKGKFSRETTISELMTPNVISVEPTDNIENCMALMTAKHVRHLPVMENDELVGVVSIGDVVRQIISDHEFTIEQLGKYITAG